MNEQEKVQFKYVVSIKFSSSKKAYNVGTDDDTLKYGDKVIVETVRGVEIGEMISDLRDFSSYSSNLTLKPVIRKATKMQQAASIKQSIYDLDPSGKATADYIDVAQNLALRILQ